VKDTKVEGGKISRIRGKSFEVLLKQGLKIGTLGEKDHSGVAKARTHALSSFPTNG
jgi:hypothetical protein